MNKKYIIIFFIVHTLKAIGLEALNIPTSAISASSTGAGIANSNDVWINPTSILNKNSKSIRFSGFNWLGQIPGNEISILWFKNNVPKYFSLQSLSIDDIELYGDNPSDQPLGKFSTSWISSSYSTGYKLNKFDIAYLLKLNFSKLYNEFMYGITVNLGITYEYKKNIKFGFNLNNFGYEVSEELRTSIPSQYGFGISYIEPLINSVIVSDLIYDKNNDNIFKIGINKSFSMMSLNLGLTKHNNDLIYGFGSSYRFNQWEINIGVTSHKNTVFDISRYLDIVWYY